MKISFGSQIIKGPWGGGNLFLVNLENYLLRKGHQVTFNLKDPDIDLILFTDPRTGRGSTSNFNARNISKYKKKVNPNVKVVQRINECDERKNTKNINKLYLNASKISDHVVFVSVWLQNLYLDLGIDKNKTSVILSGSDNRVFNTLGKTPKNKDSKFKLLTHHWSSNWMKGFDLYTHIDKLLSQNQWKDKIEFTYIGNIDKNLKFMNTKILKPLSGHELAAEIRNHDIYVTGSLNEPSGNHHIEAALCGLPVLYIESGGIPEYCQNFGLETTLYNFEDRLSYMIQYFDKFTKNIKSYPHNSEKMCENYLNLFTEIIKE